MIQQSLDAEILRVCVCVCVCVCVQQLESLVWERSGKSFVSSHNDGGYSVWAVTSGNPYTQQPVSSTIPYGKTDWWRLWVDCCIDGLHLASVLDDSVTCILIEPTIGCV